MRLLMKEDGSVLEPYSNLKKEFHLQVESLLGIHPNSNPHLVTALLRLSKQEKPLILQSPVKYLNFWSTWKALEEQSKVNLELTDHLPSTKSYNPAKVCLSVKVWLKTPPRYKLLETPLISFTPWSYIISNLESNPTLPQKLLFSFKLNQYLTSPEKLTPSGRSVKVQLTETPSFSFSNLVLKVKTFLCAKLSQMNCWGPFSKSSQGSAWQDLPLGITNDLFIMKMINQQREIHIMLLRSLSQFMQQACSASMQQSPKDSRIWSLTLHSFQRKPQMPSKSYSERDSTSGPVQMLEEKISLRPFLAASQEDEK